MKNKITSVIIIIMMMTSVTYAGFPPAYTCTNSGGTVTINNSNISILISKNPSTIYENFGLDKIKISSQILHEPPEEKIGCSVRNITFNNIQITKKDGTPMPHAYNKLANDGILNDYFVCTTIFMLSSLPGQSCE